MPEIAEVHRVCHFLRKHALGRTIASIKAQDDTIVYGKVGTSADAFKKALTGKKIIDVRQQGKYFWFEMSSPPHPLMHLGMTGWVKFSNDDSSHYRKGSKEEEWPPKFWKFVMEVEGGKQGKEKCEIAFVDARRLGRIRLVEAEGKDMRKTTPLKENGPDPVIDGDVLTVDWLVEKLRSKKVPVKALLLDQGNISGVGNWVADEVLYQAKIHPEQYSNTLSTEQMKRLHDSLLYVCKTACDLLAESDKFPGDWLMKHRWSKGKGSGSKLPNGEKIIFLTVGGRTSAVVPSVQKKTGEVSQAAKEAEAEAEAKAADSNEEEVESKAKGKSKKATTAKSIKSAKEPAKAASTKRPRAVKAEEDDDEEAEAEEPAKSKNKSKAANGVKKEDKPAAKKVKKETKPAPAKVDEPVAGRRRSGRLSKG